MPIFHCYSDTSGTQSSTDGKVLVTAAAVATIDAWNDFDKRWMAVLSEFGVTELHMKHFAHSNGQYAQWKGDAERRKDFLSRLMEVASHGIDRAFVGGLILADYYAANELYQISERVQSPYAFLQSLCFVHALEWLNKNKSPQDGAEFFIEDDDAGQGAFLNDAERILGWKPKTLTRFAPNGEAYTPLQLCDFIAYEHRLRYERAMDDKKRWPLRESFRQMRELLPIEPGIFDAEMLATWCERRSIPKRA